MAARLFRAAAQYALAGATSLQLEVQYSTLRPGEIPQLTAHLRHPHGSSAGTLRVELRRESRTLDQAQLTLAPADSDIPLPFRNPMKEGIYTLTATWTPAGAERPQEFAENGFIVEDASGLTSGDALGARGDFLTLGGKTVFSL